MKNLLLLFLLFSMWSVAAQKNCPYYTKYIEKGNLELAKGSKADFEAAINAYSTAMLHCPEAAEEARGKILEVFRAIEKLKSEAEKAQRQAQTALAQVNKEQLKTRAALAETEIAKAKADSALAQVSQAQLNTEAALAETEIAKAQADSALQKANKLINAFYFYGDRFALAYGAKGDFERNIFYFIDKNGEEVTKLGRWQKAEQFDYHGFAKIKKEEKRKLTDYLLDTTGNTYRAAYDLKDMSPEIKVLDIAGKKLTMLPEAIFEYPALEILLVDNNQFNALPVQIEELKSLRACSGI